MFFEIQVNKPLLEKRRRARINACLIQLKNIVLQSLRKDVSETHSMSLLLWFEEIDEHLATFGDLVHVMLASLAR